MIHAKLNLPEQRLAEFCRRQHIRRLSLFGSAAREDFAETSDVDLLVEFQPGAHVSLFDLVDVRDALADLFGRPVDLATPDILRNPYRRQAILKDLVPLYAA